MGYIRDLTGYIKLPFARNPVKILDKTYVFGCPQKYASSATAGIISHVNRDMTQESLFMNFACKTFAGNKNRGIKNFKRVILITNDFIKQMLQ